MLIYVSNRREPVYSQLDILNFEQIALATG